MFPTLHLPCTLLCPPGDDLSLRLVHSVSIICTENNHKQAHLTFSQLHHFSRPLQPSLLRRTRTKQDRPRDGRVRREGGGKRAGHKVREEAKEEEVPFSCGFSIKKQLPPRYKAATCALRNPGQGALTRGTACCTPWALHPAF